MRRMVIIAAVLTAVAGLAGSVYASPAKHLRTSMHRATMSVFATGFNNPRGLTFGPDGNLYVAEGGLGGSHLSTLDHCPQAQGAAAPYSGSTNDPVLGGRISMVNGHGVVTTVVSGLPSSQTSQTLGGLVSGVSSVAFLGDRLYALLAGAGCSHGVPTVPNGIIRVGHRGSWTMIANLSAFQAANPVASPDEEDFEPDGTWYSMIAAGGALYPMDSNHGELDRVTPGGAISRVIDISAHAGHVVPTAIVQRGAGDGHHGGGASFLIGNLGIFGPTDGTGDEHVWELAQNGAFDVRASGLEQVVGLAFRAGKLYALELSTTGGGPSPGTGAIVRIENGVPVETVISGLMFPTGMAVGPDGAFYVSDHGLGFGAGEGRVLRIAP